MLRPFAADVAAVCLFALLARAAHRSDAMPFTFGGWASTVWPFLLGTVLAWLLFSRVRRRPLASGVVVWLCTAVCGLVVWGVRHGHVPHISFVIVASVMSGVLLLGWRLVARRLSK